MNIDPVRVKEYIQAQNKKHLETAEQYRDICAEYGQVLNEYQRMIAVRIMIYKASKKNLGVDMARIMAMADQDWADRDTFIRVSERLNYLEYIRKGLEPLLKAYESEKISIMSLMRYDAQGERLG